MNDQLAAPTRPSLSLWLGAILVTLFGIVAGAFGALGVVFALEPAPKYDLANPPEESSYEAMVAVNAICRLDQLEEVGGDDSCVLPLVDHERPLEDYAGVPLMLKLPCSELIDLVGGEAYQRRQPVPCAPKGKSYGLDVHDETFGASMKSRYPGFVGEVMEPPTEADLEDEKETQIIFLGFLGIGVTGALGGLLVMRLAWRRRKRAIAAEG